MKFLYRLYLLLFGPIIFLIAGVLVILQTLISSLVWVVIGKGLYEHSTIGVILIKKLAPPIYNFIDSL